MSADAPNPDLQALLGTYAEVVATAMQGVRYLTELVQEAWESGDTVYARELNVVLTQNVDHWRKTFGFLKELP